jgi:hypothetical protein
MTGLKLTRFGTNCNKRYYIGIVYGQVPHGEWKPHSMYPWWKQWKIGWFKGLANI